MAEDQKQPNFGPEKIILNKTKNLVLFGLTLYKIADLLWNYPIVWYGVKFQITVEQLWYLGVVSLALKIYMSQCIERIGGSASFV